MKTALVTGSAGLIGSEAVRRFCREGYKVVGIDNDMRKYFFGAEASTDWNKQRLVEDVGTQYEHHTVDVRDQQAIAEIFQKHQFDIVVHTAAQPSHDWAAREPLTDFSVNALATLMLLEATRQHAPKATFVFTSTNKVYGDLPNYLPLEEKKFRYEIEARHPFYEGIDESMSIDQSLHSVFGASKVAADVMVQEYGRYFGMLTGVFRGGCLTGPQHSGAELHGFLAYLVKCIATEKKYTIFGYKGKQVRDNEHSADLVQMFWEYHKRPQKGEVYNTGGGRENSVSIWEAIQMIEAITGKKAVTEYKDENRIGDHIWYITSTKKFEKHYPSWRRQYDLNRILKEICEHHTVKNAMKQS